jgi:hypothetical protein
MDFKDFWDNKQSLGSIPRKQYLRGCGSSRNHLYLLGQWNHMDFKDFWYKSISL